MFTAWGYEIDGNSIPLLLDAADFNAMTGGRYAGDALREAQALIAASQAVRNACGWHISPPLACTARVSAEGKQAVLPARHVGAYEAVRELDERTGEWTRLAVPGEASVDRDGIIRRHGFRQFPPGRFNVEAEYTAGYDPAAVGDLRYAVMGIAEGVLSVPTGVTSESADGVSISYSAQAQSIADALTDRFAAALAPYKVVRGHAA